MALGYTTYKTPNAIFTINEDLSGKEGCGVTLMGQGAVAIAPSTQYVPYGIVTVGGPSEDGVTYPGLIGGSSVEFVDMLGCTVQVQVSSSSSIAVGEFVVIDNVEQDGTFTGTNSQSPAQGDWLWGLALTNAAAGEQCLIRFQPQYVSYIAP
jgi:hypothetical protein